MKSKTATRIRFYVNLAMLTFDLFMLARAVPTGQMVGFWAIMSLWSGILVTYFHVQLGKKEANKDGGAS